MLIYQQRFYDMNAAVNNFIDIWLKKYSEYNIKDGHRSRAVIRTVRRKELLWIHFAAAMNVGYQKYTLICSVTKRSM